MSNLSISKALQNHGLSTTRSRVAIFTAIADYGPLSIQDIVSLTELTVNRASVYRTIELFEKLGFVRRIMNGWKYRIELSDTFTHHHHHIVCRKCGKVHELSFSPILEKELELLFQNTGFIDIRHEIEAAGICQDCSYKYKEPRTDRSSMEASHFHI